MVFMLFPFRGLVRHLLAPISYPEAILGQRLLQRNIGGLPPTEVAGSLN
jgi:hypothetical protein